MVGERYFGCYGLEGLVSLVLFLDPCLLRFFLLVVGFLMGIWPWKTDVDFLAVVEHLLVPARVRGEWARLRARGASSVWSPASQESSHVGHGGVGVISLRGAPLSLPTSATAQFRRFFDCGRGFALFVACCFWSFFCTWLFCMGIRVQMVMQSGFRLLISCLMLLWGS